MLTISDDGGKHRRNNHEPQSARILQSAHRAPDSAMSHPTAPGVHEDDNRQIAFTAYSCLLPETHDA
jgi:hypothetical protein